MTLTTSQGLNHLQLTERLWDGLDESPPFQSFLYGLTEAFHAQQAIWILHSPDYPERQGVECQVPTTGRLFTPQRGELFDAMLLAMPPEESYTFSQLQAEDANAAIAGARPWSDVLGMHLRVSEKLFASFRLIRRSGERQFGDADRARLNQLAPIIRRALRCCGRISRLEAVDTLYQDLVETIGIGEIYLDSQGRVVHSNRVAEDILESGSILAVGDGFLQCAQADNQKRLQRTLNEFLNPATVPLPAHSIYLQANTAPGIIGLLVRPLPPCFGETAEGWPQVAIYLSTPAQQSALSAALVEQLFNLTSAEARVAVRLADGLSPGETAEALNVSRNTVRTHMAHIYAKTGVNRQSALSNLLVRALAAVWPPTSGRR